MAWTSPRTFVAGELETATIFNTHLRDNLNYLLNRPSQRIKRNNGSNYTTTSTTFVDVDSTNLKIILAMSGSAVQINVAGIVTYPTSGGYFDVTIDGTRYSGATNGITGMDGSSAAVSVAFSVIETGLSAASHTFILQWRAASANTMTLQSTSSMMVDFSVAEIG